MASIAPSRPWPRVKWTRAGQLAAIFDGLVELDGLTEAPPQEAFSVLRQRDIHQATRFIAHCLPRLDAIAWAAGCLAAMDNVTSARRLAARKAVSRWLAEPSDANRRLAYQAGEAASFATAEGAACLAVFLSGGSLAPPTQEQGVQPAAGNFGQAVAGAVMLATLNDDAPRFAERLARALDTAEQLAAQDRT
ncbi:DUF6931 family protein [Sandarakinorhabdus sp.]|uniref:DUF6931 family protein n=1 Tax=Sandarakinorhabdus sp. TaxID=1916663 RepID=UPI00286DB4D9|nr:hypothetical protein [Sandarakinorhabdus sp.]